VTPAGELIATEHRGTMYGNRGVLHNENLALVRRYQVRRWLVCVLEFRGRRRPVMRPRRYTELFFLDEAVALAAGHRPCAECRHAAYQSFRTAWAAARALPAKPAADDIDQVLHWQRRLVDGARVTYPALLSELPDGVFIVHDEEFWLANDGGQNRWTPAGYTDRIDQFDGPAAVLTPRATVEAIRAGYRPLVHPHALPDSGGIKSWCAYPSPLRDLAYPREAVSRIQLLRPRMQIGATLRRPLLGLLRIGLYDAAADPFDLVECRRDNSGSDAPAAVLRVGEDAADRRIRVVNVMPIV
jgi:hypothetical protein